MTAAAVSAYTLPSDFSGLLVNAYGPLEWTVPRNQPSACFVSQPTSTVLPMNFFRVLLGLERMGGVRSCFSSIGS